MSPSNLPGPIARRLAQVQAQRDAANRDSRVETMRPGPGLPPAPRTR